MLVSSAMNSRRSGIGVAGIYDARPRPDTLSAHVRAPYSVARRLKCRMASQRAAHPLQGIHRVGRFAGFGSDRIAMPTASGDVLEGNRVRRVASSPTTGASSERRARSPTHRSGRPAPPVARSDATGGSSSDGAPRGAVKTNDSSTTGRRTGARPSRDSGPCRGRRAPRHRRADGPVAGGPERPILAIRLPTAPALVLRIGPVPVLGAGAPSANRLEVQKIRQN